MLTDVITALGLVLVIEGLMFALAPERLKSVLKVVEEMPKDTLRYLGVAAIACGVFIVWLASGGIKYEPFWDVLWRKIYVSSGFKDTLCCFDGWSVFADCFTPAQCQCIGTEIGC